GCNSQGNGSSVCGYRLKQGGIGALFKGDILHVVDALGMGKPGKGRTKGFPLVVNICQSPFLSVRLSQANLEGSLAIIPRACTVRRFFFPGSETWERGGGTIILLRFDSKRQNFLQGRVSNISFQQRSVSSQEEKPSAIFDEFN